jgi:hypothetical protein
MRDMRWTHHQRRTGASLRENVDRAEGHECFARAALRGDTRGFVGVAEVLCIAGDGQSLGRKRLAQERRETGRDRIFRALEGWIGLKDAFGQERAKLTQVVEGGLQADTSKAKDFQEKGRGAPVLKDEMESCDGLWFQTFVPRLSICRRSGLLSFEVHP